MTEIAESYLDVWGREKKIDPATREALARALGPPRKPAKVKLEPGRCHEPELLAQGGRVWGFMAQLYGVRSKRNWGIGDFTDLATLIGLWAAEGADVVGVPVQQGRTQQLWLVTMTRADGKEVARGQVRLQNLPLPAPAR